jgi:hypothetical protein
MLVGPAESEAPAIVNKKAVIGSTNQFRHTGLVSRFTTTGFCGYLGAETP